MLFVHRRRHGDSWRLRLRLFLSVSIKSNSKFPFIPSKHPRSNFLRYFLKTQQAQEFVNTYFFKSSLFTRYRPADMLTCPPSDGRRVDTLKLAGIDIFPRCRRGEWDALSPAIFKGTPAAPPTSQLLCQPLRRPELLKSGVCTVTGDILPGTASSGGIKLKRRMQFDLSKEQLERGII